MRGCATIAPGGFGTFRFTIIGVSMGLGLLGCSRQDDATAHTRSPSSVITEKPKLFLALQPPADPRKLEPGSPLDIVCTVVSESGAFEPMKVTFSVGDPKAKGKMILASKTVGEKTRKDREFAFSYKTKAPDRPGPYRIHAKVVGVDASVPAAGPPQAPAADGTPIKPGARVEFDAPGLQIEVRP